MKNLLIPFLLIIGIATNLQAQDVSSREFSSDRNLLNSSKNKNNEKSKKEERGDKYCFNYSFDKAIKYYTQANHLSIDGQRRLAESYRNLNKNDKAEAVYEKIVNLPGGFIPEDYFNYAMVLKTNGKYGLSNIWMDKFIEIHPDDLRSKSYITNRDAITEMLKDNGNYNIEHLNINSNAEDFGTCYYKDKIVFASTRTSPKMIVKKYNWNKKPYWDMYVSEVDGRQLKSPEIFDKKLNKKLHEGPASFSNNGMFAAFTRNNYKDKSKDKVVELQICFTSNKDGKWSKPEDFVLNSNKYSVGHPCLTEDGKTMYFTSDMPGGYGGSDLYVIKRNDKGDWANPKNLGDKINTEGNEMFPFLEENNQILFFASDGHYGLGGLDIFISPLYANGFNEVYNAGYPLNTRFDDFAAIINEDMTKGYFSSNRNNLDADIDIFSFDLLKAIDVNVLFTVFAPENIPVERKVREYFPLRNYVFFDLGSTEIPERYVLLNDKQVTEFREDQVMLFTPKNHSGRSDRQMIVYYNVLNILGDRMKNNPNTTIKLIGSSEKGPDDGIIMAESVKKYLVDAFEIDSYRIVTEGSFKPKIPSEQWNSTIELDQLRKDDRRVSIESSSPSLLLEFQSGPNAPLKSVEILAEQETILDSYVLFTAKGGENALSSWSLQIIDEQGTEQNFGPFTKDQTLIQGKDILGDRPNGDFKVIMLGQTKNGNVIKEETDVHLVLWSPPEDQEVMRFSIIYEFDESKAITLYEKYLTDVVVPKISKDASVIIHGHTDNIGIESYNKLLSISRANDVRNIIQHALWKAGRNDVKFEVFGLGEDALLSPFENKFPEERFYNRTVIIDIVPK